MGRAYFSRVDVLPAPCRCYCRRLSMLQGTPRPASLVHRAVLSEGFQLENAASPPCRVHFSSILTVSLDMVCRRPEVWPMCFVCVCMCLRVCLLCVFVALQEMRTWPFETTSRPSAASTLRLRPTRTRSSRTYFCRTERRRTSGQASVLRVR